MFVAVWFARFCVLVAPAVNWLAVLAAPTAVEQILDVFLDNALALEPTGGTVRVALTRTNATITLSVEDNGPGLLPEHQERAFDRFWRGPNDYQGTGLGLAIAHQLASRSGATLTLTNRPSGGALAQAVFRSAHP